MNPWPDTYQSIVEHATDLIVRFDTAFRHVYFNKAVEREFGFTLKSAYGKTAFELGTPREQSEFIERSLRQALETRSEQIVEQRMPVPGGEKYFQTRIVPEFGESGAVESLLAISRDVTDRKRMEHVLLQAQSELQHNVAERTEALQQTNDMLQVAVEAVRVREKELNAIFENAPFAMVVVGKDRKLRKANRAMEGWVGGNARGLIGQAPGNALRCINSLADAGGCGYGPACGSCILRQTVLSVLDSGTPYFNVDIKLPFNADIGGENKTLRVSAVPIEGMEERMALVTLDDITERTKTEALAFARSRILQVSLTSVLGDILQYVLDEAEKLTESKIGFFHFMESDQRTLSLQNWSTRTVKEFCKAEGKGMHYPLEQAGIWADCARQQRPIICNDYLAFAGRRGLPEGHAAITRFLTIPIIRGGKIMAIAGVGNKDTAYSEADLSLATQLVDLSWEIIEQKRMEEALRQSELRLIQADKMASLGVLVAGVAHEINNPNNYISLSAPILRKAWENLMPVVEEHLKGKNDYTIGKMDYHEFRKDFEQLMAGIENGSRRIKRIVSDLKDYARQDAYDLNRHADLNTIAQAAVNLMGTMLKKKTRDFSMRLWKTPLPIKGSPQRLEQVIINLLHNACDALTKPAQAISLTTEERDNGTVAVVVSDQGAGMDLETLNKITDPFFTTKRDQGGTGLGLSVSAGIVKEHGGEFLFNSSPGKGTTVTVILRKRTA